MFKRIGNIRVLFVCLFVSITAHILFARALLLFGTYAFSAPVNAPPGLVVELSDPRPPAAAVTTKGAAVDGAPQRVTAVPMPAGSDRSVPTSAAALRCEPEANALPVTPVPRSSVLPPVTAAGSPASSAKSVPLAGGGMFLAAQHEKLTYQLMMFEIPVGTAELEAKYDNNETVITLRIRSNAAMSTIFPVANLVETRHVAGRFIMAKIRQQEGAFRSDELFTINPGKKRVSWVDNLAGRSQVTAVPVEDVLDTLSALYYLRNRTLAVGRAETLHIFDSEIYAEVPVEVLAREEIRLPNLTKVNTLVVRPLQKTAGLFRRTGDVLIWLTDDQNKVPVKIVTSIPLGTVTAELVAAESQPYDTAAAGMVGQTTPPLPIGRVETSVDNIQRIVERSH